MNRDKKICPRRRDEFSNDRDEFLSRSALLEKKSRRDEKCKNRRKRERERFLVRGIFYGITVVALILYTTILCVKTAITWRPGTESISQSIADHPFLNILVVTFVSLYAMLSLYTIVLYVRRRYLITYDDHHPLNSKCYCDDGQAKKKFEKRLYWLKVSAMSATITMTLQLITFLHIPVISVNLLPKAHMWMAGALVVFSLATECLSMWFRYNLFSIFEDSGEGNHEKHLGFDKNHGTIVLVANFFVILFAAVNVVVYGGWIYLAPPHRAELDSDVAFAEFNFFLAIFVLVFFHVYGVHS